MELLHLLGLCSDSLSHFDLLDMLFSMETRNLILIHERFNLFLVKFKVYAKRKRHCRKN